MSPTRLRIGAALSVLATAGAIVSAQLGDVPLCTFFAGFGVALFASAALFGGWPR